jgi:hypothetical protein
MLSGCCCCLRCFFSAAAVGAAGDTPELLLDVDAAGLQSALQWLSKYRLRRKLQLADASQQYSVWTAFEGQLQAGGAGGLLLLCGCCCCCCCTSLACLSVKDVERNNVLQRLRGSCRQAVQVGCCCSVAAVAAAPAVLV